MSSLPLSCPDCVRGSILEGTPTGAINKVNGVDAYFVSGAPSDAPKGIAVVLLTDAFGLPLVNSKLIADKIAKDLACDVWVPDLFDGQPFLKVGSMTASLLPDRAGAWPLWDKLRLIFRMLLSIQTIYRSRASVVDPRTAEFIKTIREKNNYSKLGGVGYCFGAGVAVRLVPFKLLNSLVLAHPSSLSQVEIAAIDVPTSWACAEDDMSFKPAIRLKAEAIFAERKDKETFVPYEFVDYKGTAHGFAARPNLAYEDVKAGFEGSLAQTVGWFQKTLIE
ncbi:dienelactone hydrolase endo-1-3,1,4-beta-D-glucanase [Melanogaster broomeanus]|nr:dienelactone hydrolase endo-1-3,1,4-beta-D-glucanase [Melanogaster broomeanus]